MLNELWSVLKNLTTNVWLYLIMLIAYLTYKFVLWLVLQEFSGLAYTAKPIPYIVSTQSGLISLSILYSVYHYFNNHRYREFSGALWDKKSNPKCPNCKKLMSYNYHISAGDHRVTSQLHCSNKKCKDYISLIDDSGKPITLAEAKEILKRSKS